MDETKASAVKKAGWMRLRLPGRKAGGAETKERTAAEISADRVVETTAELLAPAIAELGHVPAGHRVYWRPSVSRRVKILLGLFALLLLAAFAVRWLAGYIGIPAGLGEALPNGGSALDLLLLGVLAVAVGWGAAWLWRQPFSGPQGKLRVPLAVVVLGLLLVALLALAFSPAGAVAFLGLPSTTAGWAALFDLAMLLLPLVLCTAIIGVLVQRLDEGGLTRFPEDRDLIINSSCLLLCLVAILFVPALAGAESSLGELVARSSWLGISGKVFLGFLILIISGLVVLLSEAWFRGYRELLIVVALGLVSLPVAWLLLEKGLASNISRHGLYFSGVELMLGTGVRGMDSVPRLAVRWAGIYTLLVFFMTLGAVACSLWMGRVRRGTLEILEKRVPVKLRVYREQWVFLQQLSKRTGLPVKHLVPVIVRYVGDLAEEAPSSREAMVEFIAVKQKNKRIAFFSRPIEIKLDMRTFDELSSFNEHNKHSASRIFRKLLQVLVTISEEQG